LKKEKRTIILLRAMAFSKKLRCTVLRFRLETELQGELCSTRWLRTSLSLVNIDGIVLIHKITANIIATKRTVGTPVEHVEEINGRFHAEPVDANDFGQSEVDTPELVGSPS